MTPMALLLFVGWVGVSCLSPPEAQRLAYLRFMHHLPGRPYHGPWEMHMEDAVRHAAASAVANRLVIVPEDAPAYPRLRALCVVHRGSVPFVPEGVEP